MADPLTLGLIVSTVVSTTATVYAQGQAKDAADAQTKTQENLIGRRIEDQRQALSENSRRQQANKQRQLAQLRVNQAASGFNDTSGTTLAIFGNIETVLDEQINENTSRGLDAIGTLENQRNNLAFERGIRDQSFRTQQITTGVNTAGRLGSGYYDNYQRTGSDAFSIFN